MSKSKSSNQPNANCFSSSNLTIPKSPATETNYASAKVLAKVGASPTRAGKYTPENVISKAK
jgi:hypothetical protein